MSEKENADKDKARSWQQMLGAALGACIVAWFAALLLMFMVWSLLWVYGNLFG